MKRLYSVGIYCFIAAILLSCEKHEEKTSSIIYHNTVAFSIVSDIPQDNETMIAIQNEAIQDFDILVTDVCRIHNKEIGKREDVGFIPYYPYGGSVCGENEEIFWSIKDSDLKSTLEEKDAIAIKNITDISNRIAAIFQKYQKKLEDKSLCGKGILMFSCFAVAYRTGSGDRETVRGINLKEEFFNSDDKFRLEYSNQ